MKEKTKETWGEAAPPVPTVCLFSFLSESRQISWLAGVCKYGEKKNRVCKGCDVMVSVLEGWPEFYSLTHTSLPILSARHLCAHYFYPLPRSVLVWSLSYFTFLWSSIQICSSSWMTAESFCEVIRFKKKIATLLDFLLTDFLLCTSVSMW